MRQFAVFIISVFLAATIAAPASAQTRSNSEAVAQTGKRIALVIGNAAYSGKLGKLDNPLNDITLVAKSLRAVGFEVMKSVKNATRADMLLAIYQFTAKLKAAGPKAVGFFYYAGHGIASGGANYLIPVDVQSTKGWVLNVKGVKLDEITRLLREKAPKANHFVVFDACRNKLRGARGSRGFVPVKDRAGMLIAFSTAPGETADDGDGAQGPYAMALASELLKPGQDHLHLFQNIKSKVYRRTGEQTPWERNGMLDLVYLGGKSANVEGPQAFSTTLSEAATEWRSLSTSKDIGDLQAYITQFAKRFPYYGRKAQKRLRKLKDPKVAIGVFPKQPERPTRKSYEPEVVLIPGGTFSMGCVSGKDCGGDEKPVHSVTVGSFYLSKYETTFAQWDACVKDGDCKNGPVKKAGGDEGWGRGNLPVINVSWNDAVAYAKWLSHKTGQTWRLPTEAEWEYVARGDRNGNNRTKYSWGNGIDCRKANYGNGWSYSCKSVNPRRTKTVGSFSANKFGVYDMHGNVWEWVHDWKGKYKSGHQTDPKGPASGSYRVSRGGSWYRNARSLRSADRSSYSPVYRVNNLGFRLLRQPS